MYRVDHHLVNGAAGDPALCLALGGARGSLLFDCGHLMEEPVPNLHRVKDIFVSHAHIDHFFGFDWFMRMALGQDRSIRIWGPEGILGHVESKLRGYTWNIAMDFRLEFVVHEVTDEVAISQLWCEEGLHRERLGSTPLAGDGLLQDRYSHWIHYAELDHDIPSLAFRFTQKRGVHLNVERMEELGGRPGPWIGDFKRWVLRGASGEAPLPEIGIGVEQLLSLSEVKPGFSLAYVADTLYTPAVEERVVELARGVDVFYCAGRFLHGEQDRAASSSHLTARQAGRLARLAEVEELVLFHPSKKYQADYEQLVADAAVEFPRVSLPV